MKATRAAYGVVNLAALDLRHRPDHRSELKSQLLLGEVVRRLSWSRDRRWWRVENHSDRYRGWVRTWGVVPASSRAAAEWAREARARVAYPYTEVRDRRGRGGVVTPLFWGGRAIAGRREGGFRAIRLPDGRRGWVRAAALQVGRGRHWSLARRVRGLMGVPYLWGGRTPLGMDCSAFTQLVLGEQGIWLPRDAQQQFRASRELRPRESLGSGDLVFFGPPGGVIGHVGLALGGGYYAHSRGRVRISSLNQLNRLWDKELASQLRGLRRPV